jgi:hypothetical protein
VLQHQHRYEIAESNSNYITLSSHARQMTTTLCQILCPDLDPFAAPSFRPALARRSIQVSCPCQLHLSPVLVRAPFPSLCPQARWQKPCDWPTTSLDCVRLLTFEERSKSLTLFEIRPCETVDPCQTSLRTQQDWRGVHVPAFPSLGGPFPAPLRSGAFPFGVLARVPRSRVRPCEPEPRQPATICFRPC